MSLNKHLNKKTNKCGKILALFIEKKKISDPFNILGYIN